MALREIILPHRSTYNFGVGVDRLSGSAMNLVVKPIQIPPIQAGGNIGSFEVSRVSTTDDLQRSLGIDLSASYGCACFGAGISARFSYSEQSKVHAESLFLAITATAHLADLSIDECILTDSAAGEVVHPDIFTERYGDMFNRACRRGGLFVGLMRIETFDATTANSIEGDLSGSYGLFSAEAKIKFSESISKHQTRIYCSVYTEGGPPIQITDPGDPKVLLEQANAWMSAMYKDPSNNAVPYEWTLAPMTIAEGPPPLNAADIEHAQDVLMFCAKERVTLQDKLNQLSWWVDHQDKYDWSAADPIEKLVNCIANLQTDLDTVAACASAAMDNPRQCLLPADYAKQMQPPRTYPLSEPFPKGPKPLPAKTLPIVNHWYSAAPMSLTRFALAAVTGLDGRIYALGGINGKAFTGTPTVEAYNPQTNTWTLVAAMSTPRDNFAAVAGPDGRIYALGGEGDQATGEAYNPQTNTWTPIAPMSTSRNGLAAVTGPDGRIYALGGVIGSRDTPTATGEAYNPQTNTWTPIAPMSTPRFLLAAVTGPDGRIYALGGSTNSSSTAMTATVEAYDIHTNTWTSVASMSTTRMSLGAVARPDGRIYVLGGTNDSHNTSTATVEAYDPQNNIWTPVVSMPTARWSLAATVGQDGCIYALGGYNGNLGENGVLNTVEVGCG